MTIGRYEFLTFWTRWRLGMHHEYQLSRYQLGCHEVGERFGFGFAASEILDAGQQC